MSALPSCPRCAISITAEQPRSSCESCMAVHHLGCWANFAACAVCSAARSEAQADSGSRLVGTLLSSFGLGLALLTALVGWIRIAGGNSFELFFILVVSQPFVIASVVFCLLGVRRSPKLAVAGLAACGLYELSLLTALYQA